MPWDCIHKPIPAPGSPPNLGSYPEACRTFSWPAARQELDGLPGGALNIAYEAVDRHVIHGRGELLALRWLAKDGTRRDLTYDDLARLTNRFANVLTSLGIGKGDAVFGLCNRIPALTQLRSVR